MSEINIEKPLIYMDGIKYTVDWVITKNHTKKRMVWHDWGALASDDPIRKFENIFFMDQLPDMRLIIKYCDPKINPDELTYILNDFIDMNPEYFNIGDE